jgi:hypothetical protein
MSDESPRRRGDAPRADDAPGRVGCDVTGLSCIAFSLYQEFEKIAAVDPARPISKAGASHLDALIAAVRRSLPADDYLCVATADHVPGECVPVQDATLHLSQIGRALGRAYARAREAQYPVRTQIGDVHLSLATVRGDAEFQLWLAASTG